MGVKVYFEGGNCSWADHVATFADEECYNICSEALEKYAIDNGFITVSYTHLTLPTIYSV